MTILNYSFRFCYLLCVTFYCCNDLSLAINVDFTVHENVTLPDFENVTLPNLPTVTLPDTVNVTLPENGSLADDVAAVHLYEMQKDLTPYLQTSVQKQWDYNTNITDETEKAMDDASVAFSTNYRSWWEGLIYDYNYEDLSDYYKRQFEMQQSIDTSILSEEDLENLNDHLTNMLDDYGAKVCPWDDKKCDEDEEGYDIDKLEELMATETDYSILLYYWEKWRDASGKEMIDDFKAYVDLMNIAAANNSFTDAGQMWIEPYTTYKEKGYMADDFQSDIERLWLEIKPYYQKLYGYVRYKLKLIEDYEKYFDDSDLIPAHILGNMWAQSWENIYDIVAPYPDVTLPDISETLEKRNNTKEMFEIAEDFFVSMGMFKMTSDFWENSMMDQPKDGRKVVCHASAWDFYSTDKNNVEDGKYRIKMCTNHNQEDFIVVHHEMGHVEYYMSYANQTPIIYRDGANPGFHEAIGDTIALAVSTPTHLQLINDTLNGKTTQESNQVKAASDEDMQNINYLMKQALAKVAFLPYAYILDSWRWAVFNGSIEPEVYNKRWWEMRIDYQGLRPPIARSPENDFDIGCKYHVPANVPYIRYFVAHILQFQFYEQLCKVAGKDKPNLFNCDFYGNETAGQALMEMLSKGASVHWQEQLKDFLGSEEGNMNSSAIINYFQPLWEFLDKEITNKSINTNWTKSSDVIDDYMNDMEEISAAVPITVGIVLAVLVCIVLVAFFYGQRKRSRQEKELEKNKEADLEKGKDNNGIELDEKGKESITKIEELKKDELTKEDLKEVKEEDEEEEEEEDVEDVQFGSNEQSDHTSIKDDTTLDDDVENSKI
ncbi:UNVERIFIED_CONTAM: hypothetical protein RMT77_006055 [Armadillidium vulgare]